MAVADQVLARLDLLSVGMRHIFDMLLALLILVGLVSLDQL